MSDDDDQLLINSRWCCTGLPIVFKKRHNLRHTEHNTVSTDNINIRGSFSDFTVGLIRTVQVNLDQHQCKPISDEGDPQRTALSIRALLTSQSISVLNWPTNSPVLNSIEHLWQEIKKKVNYHTSLDGLFIMQHERAFCRNVVYATVMSSSSRT